MLLQMNKDLPFCLEVTLPQYQVRVIMPCAGGYVFHTLIHSWIVYCLDKAALLGLLAFTLSLKDGVILQSSSKGTRRLYERHVCHVWVTCIIIQAHRPFT